MERIKQAQVKPSPTTLPVHDVTSSKTQDQIDASPFTFRPEPYCLPTKQNPLVKTANYSSATDDNSKQPYIGSTLFIEDVDGQILTVKEHSKHFFAMKENGIIIDHKLTALDFIPNKTEGTCLNVSQNNLTENSEIELQNSHHRKSLHKIRRKNGARTLKNNIPLQINHPISSLQSFEPMHKIPEGELKKFLPKNWKIHKIFPLPICSEITLDANDPEYIQVAAMFKKKMKRLHIKSIARVENPFLWIKYMLRREDSKKLYKNTGGVETRQFHSTKSKNIDEILQNNFNWRKYGSNVGHKYGRGVSFSYSAPYSSTYSDNFPYLGNKMLLVRLLIACVSVGDDKTVLPPNGSDTTTRPDGMVCVKYEDDSFYPEYLISFWGDQVKNKRYVNFDFDPKVGYET